MKEYDKYKKDGDLHWHWYFNLKHPYKTLVDESLAPFRQVSKFDLGTLVDIGCGDGIPLSFLARTGFICTGVDPDGAATAFAEYHGVKADFFNEKAEEFVKRELEYDYLYSLNVIEHLDNPEVMVEMMRRVKNFGVIVTDRALGEVSPYHAREYSPVQFEALFKDFELTKLPVSDDEYFGYIIKNKLL
jgi:2-polyprenyl-3-methyl-5-hydroxy-6-metoxy-1,4-benzoquinol methylase